jgi:hypothetical protein
MATSEGRRLRQTTILLWKNIIVGKAKKRTIFVGQFGEIPNDPMEANCPTFSVTY